MSKNDRKIEQISIDALIPYARNSRTHSDAQVAQIAASIREFGFTNPVLIDKDGGIQVDAAPGKDVVVNNGAQSVARKNDAVQVTIHPGDIITAGGNNTNTVTVTGTITAGAGNFKG